MERLLAVASLAALAAGLRHASKYMRRNGKRRHPPPALATWESEGGAVPVAPGHTAAQVAPRALSPRADA